MAVPRTMALAFAILWGVVTLAPLALVEIAVTGLPRPSAGALAAVAGLGIINSPTFIVAGLLAEGALVSILEDYRQPAQGIHAVYPPGRLIPRRVAALADFLAGRFGDLPAWDRAPGVTDNGGRAG